jgi:hypothetical protein
MENLLELSSEELKTIDGGLDGATFAYRVGEGIRFLSHSAILGVQTAYTMVYSWQ